MTDLREAIALTLCNFDSARLDVPTVETIDDFRSQVDRDVYLGMADAVLAILPDAEAPAVIAGNIASYIDLNDCDGRSNDDALEIPLGDLRRLRVALANYRKGTGREG